MVYIPEIKSIAKRISENKFDSNTTIISLLSQIASVIGSWHHHRIVFPHAVIIGLLTLENGSFNKDMAETIVFFFFAKGHFTLTSSFGKIKGICLER